MSEQNQLIYLFNTLAALEITVIALVNQNVKKKKKTSEE